MTLILKSNNSFHGTPIGDIFGVTGTKLDWKSMLSFSDNQYSANSQNMSFDDVVSFSRASDATHEKDGQLVNVPANMERLSEQGLLLESFTNNLMLNSNTPASQTIRLQKNTWYKYGIVGDGSINVTHPNAQTASGAVTEGGIGIIYITDDAANAQISISGANNTHAYVSAIYGSITETSEVETKSAAVGKSVEVAALKPLVHSSIDTFTIVFNVSLQKAQRSVQIAELQPLLEVQLTNGAIIDIASIVAQPDAVGATPKQRLRLFYNGVEKQIYDTATTSDNLSFALSVSTSGVKISKNGGSVTEFPFVGASIKDIYLGHCKSWLNGAIAMNGYFSRLAFYDYYMSDAELSAVSASWV